MEVLVTIDDRQIRGARFKYIESACLLVKHSIKPMRVLWGAKGNGSWNGPWDGLWVVSVEDAEILINADYQYA